MIRIEPDRNNDSEYNHVYEYSTSITTSNNIVPIQKSYESHLALDVKDLVTDQNIFKSSEPNTYEKLDSNAID